MNERTDEWLLQLLLLLLQQLIDQHAREPNAVSMPGRPYRLTPRAVEIASYNARLPPDRRWLKSQSVAI